MNTDPPVRKMLTQFRLVQNIIYEGATSGGDAILICGRGSAAALLMHAGGNFPNWVLQCSLEALNAFPARSNGYAARV